MRADKTNLDFGAGGTKINPTFPITKQVVNSKLFYAEKGKPELCASSSAN